MVAQAMFLFTTLIGFSSREINKLNTFSHLILLFQLFSTQSKLKKDMYTYHTTYRHILTCYIFEHGVIIEKRGSYSLLSFLALLPALQKTKGCCCCYPTIQEKGNNCCWCCIAYFVFNFMTFSASFFMLCVVIQVNSFISSFLLCSAAVKIVENKPISFLEQRARYITSLIKWTIKSQCLVSSNVCVICIYTILFYCYRFLQYILDNFLP